MITKPMFVRAVIYTEVKEEKSFFIDVEYEEGSTAYTIKESIKKAVSDSAGVYLSDVLEIISVSVL